MRSHLYYNRKAQHLIEYALVIGIVAAAMVAMFTYVNRSVQSVEKEIEKGIN